MALSCYRLVAALEVQRSVQCGQPSFPGHPLSAIADQRRKSSLHRQAGWRQWFQWITGAVVALWRSWAFCPELLNSRDACTMPPAFSVCIALGVSRGSSGETGCSGVGFNEASCFLLIGMNAVTFKDLPFQDVDQNSNHGVSPLVNQFVACFL